MLFFLLVGRYLDCLMRERARSAVTGLARLAAKGATRIRPDGGSDYLPLEAIEPGMTLRVAAGERCRSTSAVLRGATDVDRSLVTGEAAPVRDRARRRARGRHAQPDRRGRRRALRAADASFLAEVMRMLEAAEQGRGATSASPIAPRGSMRRWFTSLAAATFLGWLVATGGDWRAALFVAISVLIITCPCALGLAVPVVHVVAAGRLFRDGIMMRDGSALERLAGIDRVVFDKTGTLTTGEAVVTGGGPEADDAGAAARTLALASTHPASRAVAAYISAAPLAVEGLREVRGAALRASSVVAARGSGTAAGLPRSPADPPRPQVPPSRSRGRRPGVPRRRDAAAGARARPWRR